MKNLFDTIAAIATPLNTGGIGVVRISGEKSYEIIAKIFSGKIETRKINYGWITENGQKVDEVIVLPFKGPRSFTGEDVIEIQSHGSPIIVKEILNLVLKNGARLAHRGEFTKRAFLNHRIDLSQAEAVLELINAKTAKTASLMANNLSGALKNEIDAIKIEIIELLAKILATLDFPDDVKEVEYSEIIENCEKSIQKIEKILKNAKAHNILREGVKIAIIGKPNVGKSSLFNALLNLERAIVTDIAGTTRDTITESLDINGISATLIDTAGIREGSEVDKVEKIGVEQSKYAIENSDIVLCLFDGTSAPDDEDKAIFELIETSKKCVYVATKQDEFGQSNEDIDFKHTHNLENVEKVSAKTSFGIENLKSRIYDHIIGVNPNDTEFLTNQRQQECLNSALSHLLNSKNAAEIEELQDLISIDIKSALIALDEISGEVVTEEVLTHIFERFCIGK